MQPPYSTLLFLCFSLLASTSGWGQTGEQFLDVVERRKGPRLEGTLIGYDYGKEVVLLDTEGELQVVPWREVGRVRYRTTVESAPPRKSDAWRSDTVPGLPERKWRHQLTATTGFTRENSVDRFGFQGSFAVIAPGLHYHFLRSGALLGFGAGGGYEVMHVRRGERMASLTALVERRFGRNRVQPVLRLQAGGSLPVGSDQITIYSRSLGYVLHPALGLMLGSPTGRWMDLGIDLGYRFASYRFRAETANFEVVERHINYQRFTLSLTARF